MKLNEMMKFLEMSDPRSPNFNPAFNLDTGERGLRILQTAEGQRRVIECAKLMLDVYTGKRDIYHLKQAMTTSDFPLLYGNVLYRSMLGAYDSYPVTYPLWMKVVEVNDFREISLMTMDGGGGILEEVKERAPYPEITFVEGEYKLRVSKFGRRYSISFEMIVNDNINAWRDRPNSMALGARRSEEYLATQMIAGLSGPNATFFSVGNANIITGNPALDIEGLQAGFTQLAVTAKDSDGHPIPINMVNLIVGPALEMVAQNILNATILHLVAAGTTVKTGATAVQQMEVANWMRNRVRLVVLPYLPSIATTANAGTTWFLTASSDEPRPAFFFAFMRGRQQPQLFIKDSNQRSIGGGPVDELEGDFDTDSIDYKQRHIFGAAQGNPKMAVASNGSGS